MVVAILQGRVTTGNPVLQLPPGKESSGFQLPAILTFPQCRGRGSVRFPSPQNGAQSTLATPGHPKLPPPFGFLLLLAQLGSSPGNQQHRFTGIRSVP